MKFIKNIYIVYFLLFIFAECRNKWTIWLVRKNSIK